MNLKSMLDGLEHGIETAQKIAGPAAALGIPYAGLAQSLLEVATNVRQRVVDGAVVATSDDHERIAKIIIDLEAANDRLNAEIEKS